MTREQFEIGVNDWVDLLDFCSDNELTTCDGIFLVDELDAYICEDIREYIQANYWYNLRDRLDDIYENGDVYCKNGVLDYVCLDDEFEPYKSDVMSEMDERGLWDDDDEDEEDEDDYYEFLRDYTPAEREEIEDSKYQPIEFGDLLSESKDETSKISLNNPEVGDIEAFICAAAATTPSSV